MEKLNSSNVVLEREIWVKQSGEFIVYIGHQKSTPHEKICIKVQTLNSSEEANNKMMEVISMAKADHESIVKLFSISLEPVEKDKYKLFSFMEYFPEGNLDELIEKRMLSNIPWTQEQLLNYAYQLINAMSYLQEMKISHRDLKPSNIFISKNETTLKIGKFQESKSITTEIQTIKGSPLYFSPLVREALSKFFKTNIYKVIHNSYKSDVYSLGIILLQMASLKPITDLCVLDNLQEKINIFIDNLSDDHFKIKLLLNKMLQVEENLRDDFFTLLPYVIKLMEAGYEKCPECGKYTFHSDFYIVDNDFVCGKCVYDLNMLYDFRL